jgi:ribosomal protein L37E
MSSPRPNLTLDERSFEGLLSAAFTIQEYNDRKKSEFTGALSETDGDTLCRHCGAAKSSSDTSRCGSCGLDEFRPGERLQRNWASMWLHSQYQDEWPESSPNTSSPHPSYAHTEDKRGGLLPADPRARYASQGISTVAEKIAEIDVNSPTLTALSVHQTADTDSHFNLSSQTGFDLAPSAASPEKKKQALPLRDRLSPWHIKLRFRRADLYLGLAIFVAAIALLWPAAVPRHPATLAPWERALVALGIAEAPTPVVHLQGDPTVNVWIDPHTALYYCPGDELYEKTGDGRLSSQHDAQTDRFEPASRAACE